MEMRWKWIDHSVNSNDLEGDETNEDLCRIIFFLLGKRRYYKKYFLKSEHLGSIIWTLNVLKVEPFLNVRILEPFGSKLVPKKEPYLMFLNLDQKVPFLGHF